MTARTALLVAYCVGFVAFTFYVVATEGVTGFTGVAFGGGWGSQISLDLVTALVIALGWLARDARQHGWSPVPWVVLTLFTGSIGPMAYLIRRELAGDPEARTASARA